MTHSLLTEKKFKRLVSELSSLIEAANQAAATEKVAGYWAIGERIVRERIATDAGYHHAILRDLARATDISIRTLQRSVAFHEAYKKPPADGLSWMHYQILSTLEKKSERAFYQKEAIAQQWNVRQLQDAVHSSLFCGGQLEARVLERPTSLSYCYLGQVERIIDGDTLDLVIDLGFRTWSHQRTRLAHIDAPEANTPEGRAARNCVAREVARAKTLVIKSHKADLYGRYVSDLFLSPSKVSLEECFHTGRYLNEVLVQQRHAVVKFG